MPARTQRIKIGKSFFVPVLLKVVATNPDGSPRWLEIMGDDETANIEHGSRQFYLVWGSELLAGRARQNGKSRITTAEPPSPAGDLTIDLGERQVTVPVAEGEPASSVAERAADAINTQDSEP